MPSGVHQQKVELPIQHVWSFVNDMNNWAPLVPGYTEHTILSDKQSTWKFKGEVGIVQKTVHLQVDITSWQKPSKITFNLTGLNENVKGDGYFEAHQIKGNLTNITGCINITAKGLKSPLINSVLKSFVPRTTKALTEAVVHKLQETKVAAAT